jgi:hypothetical protein
LCASAETNAQSVYRFPVHFEDCRSVLCEKDLSA